MCFSPIASVLSAARKRGDKRSLRFVRDERADVSPSEPSVFSPDARIGDTESPRYRAVRSLGARCHLEAAAALCRCTLMKRV